MTVTVNGKEQDLPPGMTIADLLRRLGAEGVPAAVEVNRQVVPRARHEQVELRDGDSVEVVTLVGGG